MDFRIDQLKKMRVLPDQQTCVRVVLDRAPQAEAWAQRATQRVSPLLAALYAARRRIATASVVLITASLLIHVLFGANGMVVYRQKKAEYQQLQKQIDTLQKQNDAATARINSLQHDSDALEKEAREQLHYTRPGEVIYFSPQASPAEQNHRSATKAAPAP